MHRKKKRLPDLKPDVKPGLTVRFATRRDVPTILKLIRALAEYEKLSHQVVATEAGLRASLFGQRRVAEVLLAFEGRQCAGFALFFHNFSTFLGKPGIYLEDLYILPEYRGRGHGRALMTHLARLAHQRQCGRLEWWVLDWNQPAIDFYRSLGAVPMSEWTVNRVTGPALRRLAARRLPGDPASRHAKRLKTRTLEEKHRQGYLRHPVMSDEFNFGKNERNT